MIRYTVAWDESVDAHFLEAWLKSDQASRAALTEAANAIDRALGVDAEQLGEQQSEEGTRAVVLHLPPASITVFFRVSTSDRIARVTRLAFRRQS